MQIAGVQDKYVCLMQNTGLQKCADCVGLKINMCAKRKMQGVKYVRVAGVEDKCVCLMQNAGLQKCAGCRFYCVCYKN